MFLETLSGISIIIVCIYNFANSANIKLFG